ncbi:MAG: zf-HC2 domain-containing protein [Candidatus Acidiferrum sp.]
MTWNCEQIEARLSDYLDGLLTPDERREFDAHVNDCEACVPLLASVSHLLSDLRSLEAIPEPPRLAYDILNLTLGPRAVKKGWLGGFSWVRLLTSPRFAYSAVSLVATALIILTASGFSFRKPKLADLSPVNIYRTADRQAHLVYARSTKFVSDLRVVYEIQSRLNKDNELPTEPESTVPQSAPGKNPGSTDGTKPATPRQQNRANGIGREIEVLAEEIPVVSLKLCPMLLGRRLQ